MLIYLLNGYLEFTREGSLRLRMLLHFVYYDDKSCYLIVSYFLYQVPGTSESVNTEFPEPSSSATKKRMIDDGNLESRVSSLETSKFEVIKE